MKDCNNHSLCIKSALKSAQQICANNNVRLTITREKTLEIILQSHQPQKAYGILEILQTIDKKAKPITVYRALDFLVEQGLIHKIHSLSSYVGCFYSKTQCNCYFVICNICKMVEEYCGNSLQEYLQSAPKNPNSQIDISYIEAYGTCKTCLGAME